MKEDIEKILDDSVTAPSPDNYQPWRFEVRGNIVYVFKVPGRVNALLDCHEHVLLLTSGMLLETLAIAASARGYSATIRYFPDAGRPDCVAAVALEPSGIAPDPLFAFLR